MTEHLVILMRRSETISLKDAVARYGMSDRRLRDLCSKHRISRQPSPGSPLTISGPALEMVMHGDLEALELLRDGNRAHPRVKRYFDHLGIPVTSTTL